MNEAFGSGVMTLEGLTNLYVLDSLKGFGPQKFKQVYEAGLDPAQIIEDPKLLPVPGKKGDPIREQLSAQKDALLEECRRRAEKQLKVAAATQASIISYASPFYPGLGFQSNNPIALLYVRGNTEILKQRLAVACVGSRQLRPPFKEAHAAFARTAVADEFVVVSGFALGADTTGHEACVESGGKTIAVMPSGLDRPFPPENKALWERLLAGDQAVFVSEFPFGTGAASLNLRKRNKLIVALAKGVLVSQSSATGGAMNAYRFSVEQRKPSATFEPDETEDTSGNRLMLNESPPATRLQVGASCEREYTQWLALLASST